MIHLMDFSIVIVHYNTTDLLKRLLESLQRDSLLHRTIVLDCASTEFDIGEFRNRFDAQYLCLPTNRGYSFAVNRGISCTETEVVLLLNADVLINGQQIRELLEIWASLDRPAALGPMHRNERRNPQMTCGQEPTVLNEWRRKRLERALRHGDRKVIRKYERSVRGIKQTAWVSGSCMLLSREAIETVGPWDEAYFLYFEDMDWCLRARDAGFLIYYTSEVSVRHEHGASMLSAPKETQDAYRQSQVRFFSSRWGPLTRDLLYFYLRLSGKLKQPPVWGTATPKGMRSPRVLHVVASLEGGGAEHVRLLARGLIDRGWETSVCTNQTETGSGDWSRVPLVACDFESEALGRGAHRLRQLIRDGNWDVVHFHGHRAGAIGRAAIIRLKNRPRIVLTYHGYHPPNYRSTRNRMLATAVERLFRRKTDRFIAVSPSVARDVARWVEVQPEKIYLVPNAIDRSKYSGISPEHREKTRNELGLAPRDIMILSVGRLHRQKGLRFLIEAVSHLGDESEPFVTFIAGEGPERESLSRLASEIVSPRRCVLLGRRNDVPSLLSAADLFVLPSLWEGCPLVVLEVWSAGVPLVATDVPGTRDMVHNGENGLLIPVRNPDAIAEAIKRIRSDSGLGDRIIEGGFRSLENYSLDGMVDQTLGVYTGSAAPTTFVTEGPSAEPDSATVDSYRAGVPRRPRFRRGIPRRRNAWISNRPFRRPTPRAYRERIQDSGEQDA